MDNFIWVEFYLIRFEFLAFTIFLCSLKNPTRVTVIHCHLKICIFLCRHMWCLFQEDPQPLLCSLGYVVDHMSAQLVYTKLFTCNKKWVWRKKKQWPSQLTAKHVHFVTTFSHQIPELSEWVKRQREKSLLHRTESPCRQAESWLPWYERSPPISWLPPWKSHRWYRHHPCFIKNAESETKKQQFYFVSLFKVFNTVCLFLQERNQY